MKILILTQPLGHNYGGLLQAYALQTHLLSMGFEVVTLNYRRPVSETISKALEKGLKSLVKLVLRKGGVELLVSNAKKYHGLVRFRDAYLNLSPALYDIDKVTNYFREGNFNGVVVGSDQVWRPKYSPRIESYFLDFIHVENESVRRISYAASFGVDNWEYSEAQTEICGRLLRKFDSVSVRESSAVQMCIERFVVEAEVMPDPTLLLSAEDYQKLITKPISTVAGGKLLTYILGETEEKNKLIANAATLLQLEAYPLTPQKNLRNLDNAVYVGVDEWLYNFSKCDFVVTDSFHGCVFSIIFNKNFIAIGNVGRGVARFDSLFDLFNIDKRRLVMSIDEFDPACLMENIDWVAVEKTRLELISKGSQFLINSLVE